MLQKVNDSGMDEGAPSPLPETSIQEPGRSMRPEDPVDTMLKDMATIIFSTFLLAGWVAFVITYPKVSQTTPPSGLWTEYYLPEVLKPLCDVSFVLRVFQRGRPLLTHFYRFIVLSSYHYLCSGQKQHKHSEHPAKLHTKKCDSLGCFTPLQNTKCFVTQFSKNCEKKSCKK